MAIRITREAEASWQGTTESGDGRMSLGSGAFEGPYSLRARVEDVPEANPEELIGAAHAGCFTMSLANLLGTAGTPATELRTTARVRLEQEPTGFSITRIELRATGRVPGIDAAAFSELAEQAKETCPVSRALAGTDIVLAAELLSAGSEVVP